MCDESILSVVTEAINQRAGCVFTLTYAQTIDGSIASERGKQTSISCPEAFEFTHKLRAIHEALMIGVGTLNTDNPSLTTRLVEGNSPQAIILDSNLRINLQSKVLTSCPNRPIVICSHERASRNDDRMKELIQTGAQVWPCDVNEFGQVDIFEAMQLVEKHFKSVMIEGGAGIISAILTSENCVDKISRTILTIAPGFLGGLNALQKPLTSLKKWKIENCGVLGQDILVSMTT